MKHPIGGGLFSSVADPGSSAFLTRGSGSGMGKKLVSGMNIDYFSESLETVFVAKFGSGILVKQPGSAT
jgi:hypothetical protein